MKKISRALFLGLLLLSSMSVMAQSLRVAHQGYTQSTITFKAPQLHIANQQVGGVTYDVVSYDGAAPSTTLGQPNLPVISQMVQIPLCSNVQVAVSDIQVKSLAPLKNQMMPVQPYASKSSKSALPFVIDSAFYATNSFTDAPAAWVEKMGVARDRNLAILRVNPLSYNPVTGELQEIVSMTVTLTFENADVEATQQLSTRFSSPDFGMGQKLLTAIPQAKAVSTSAPLHYLIVAHSMFRDKLDDFIAWKKRQGFIVTVGYTDDAAVGSTNTSIAAYTKSFYTNATPELPAPTYLLLVGDHQQIPAFSARCTSPASDHVTDLYFASWTDGDNLPDCYWGRFSARSLDELTPQIEKTLWYEGYQFTDDSYLSRGVLIAGEDRGYTNDNAYTYADPAMDYIAKYYVNAANGFTDVKYYKNNTSFAPTGVNVDGSSQTSATASALRALYNNGYGFINYSAHGYDDSWSTPSFTNTHVASMTNNGMPSIMIGNCCLTGKFNTTAYDACFGETLLRKGNKAGAVAYIGGTNSTYWVQDFCWSVGYRTSISNTCDPTYDSEHLGMYDRLFHTHGESFSAWHPTMGSMINAGNTVVNLYSGYSLYYWEIYELFGDPSLMPWLSTAADMTLDASDVIPLGDNTYNVTAVPYAYVALTTAEGHDFVAAAYADADGVAVITLPDNMNPGDYELVAWAQNYKTTFKSVLCAVLDGPYVVVADITPAAGQVHAGEVSYFDVTITNLGNSAPTEGLITLTATGNNANVIQREARFSACNPGDTVTLTGVLATYFPNTLSDGTRVPFAASVNFGGTSPSTRNIAVPVAAAKLVAGTHTVTPAIYSSTTSTLAISVTNEGSVATDDITFSLECPFGLMATPAATVHQGVMNPDDEAPLTFEFTMGANLPIATIPFYLYAQTAEGTQLVKQFDLRCGAASVEDFESGNLTAFPWDLGTNPWEITSNGAYAGNYCARSKSNLSDYSSSRMDIDWTASVDDSISFYYKVSSERNYDKFYFQMDDVDVELEGGNSGEVEWTRVSLPVAAGNHTFSFIYTKDRNQSSGSDCAFIDNLSLPFVGTRCNFVIDTVCQNSEYTFAGNAIATDQVGHFAYVDNSSSVVEYLSLEVMPEPEVTIEVVRYGNSSLLIAHGASSYLWSTGETTSCIAVTPEASTTITVTGYRGNCSGEASTTLLDIHSVVPEANVQLYPNPAHDRVVVAAEGIRSVELINLMGQRVVRKQVNGNTVALDLQHIPSGVYFVRVETSTSAAVKKLVRK